MDSVARRCFYALTIASLVAAMYLSDRPRQARELQSLLERSYYRAWIQKEYTIEGLHRLDGRVVQKNLPLERSNLWWVWNREVVASALGSIPLVQSAKVDSCAGHWWGCFVVSIDEREPAFYLLLQKEGWLIGEDGGVIGAVAADELSSAVSRPLEAVAERGRGGAALPIVTGLWSPSMSPDVVRSRLADVPRIVQLIGNHEFPIRTITFRSGSDFIVHFDTLPFAVTFDLAAEDNWESQLQGKVQRFRSVVRELGASVQQVRSIDLAFTQIAVVKTSGDVLTASQKAVAPGSRASARISTVGKERR